MTRSHQLTLGVFALLAICITAVVFVASVVDLSRQKVRIESLVLEQTGRQLQINGEANASVIPWFGLSLTDVTLENAPEFGDGHFMEVGSTELHVALLPLLGGKIQLDKIALHDLSLTLERDADGKTNWDDLMAVTAVVETESGDNVMREIEASAPIIAALSSGDVQVTDAKITYTDAQDESYLALNDLNLNTGTVVLSEPFAFEADFNAITSAASGLTSVVDASGEVAIDLVNNIYVLQQLTLSTLSSGEVLPLESLPLSVQGEVVADFNKQNVDITLAEGQLSGVPISGEFHVANYNDQLRLTGMLSSGEFDAAPVVDQLNLAYIDQLPAELLQRARVSARFEHMQDVLHIQNFQASVSDIDLTGDFQIANPVGSGVLSGHLHTNSFSPAPWLQSVGLNFEDNMAMRQAQLSTDIRQSGQLLSFNQIELKLDDSNITGSIEFSDIKSESLPVTFALAADRINLDNYAPVTGNTEAEITSGYLASGVSLLRQLVMDGELSIGEVTLAGVTAQNALLPLRVDDGRLEIAEATADLYSGSFFSTASLDVQSEQPLFAMTANLHGLNAELWLSDLLGRESPLTGIANLSVDLLSRVPPTRGFGWSQLGENASGALSLRVTDGLLKGIDIASELREAGRQIDGAVNESETDVTQGESPATGFTEYSLSAVLADGLLQSNDLVFLSPFLRLTGEGGVNVSTHIVDYLLHLAVVSDTETDQDDTLQRLSGTELTIPVRGPYTDFYVDLPQLLLKTFQTGLTREVKSQYTVWSDSPQLSVQEKIAAEKKALRLRLEEEQQNAADVIKEKNLPQQISAEELQKQLERKTLQDRLRNNLKDGLKDGLNG